MQSGPLIERGQGAATEPLDFVAEALRSMRFGTIQLTVHEGKLLQVDVTERRRFT